VAAGAANEHAAVSALRAALMLLTRLPVGKAPLSPAGLRWGPAFFPLAGAVVGAAGAGVLAVCRPHAGGWLAAVLALAATILLTGALHEDGLADTADAFGGAPPGDRERLFAILKDPRHGSFGVLALVLALLMRAAALARLDGHAPAALLLAAVLSRGTLVWLMAWLPYVTPAALARSAAAAHAGPAQLVVATAATALLAVGVSALGWLDGAAVVRAAAAAAAVTALAGWRFRARAGGITGDLLGASQQLAEIAVLLALVLATAAP
jgi:adenosylcobinamide-GDP ribazoletransferase